MPRRRPVIVAGLFAVAVALVTFVSPRSRLAGARLVPCMACVSFVAWLDYRVVDLNGPFA